MQAPEQLPEGTTNEAPSAAVTAGLFVVSAAILAIEVLHTRIFAYSLDSLLIYAAVGVALLGIGASGTALALWDGWRRLSIGLVGGTAASFRRKICTVVPRTSEDAIICTLSSIGYWRRIRFQFSKDTAI